MSVGKLIWVVGVGVGVGLGSAARADDGSWSRTYDLAQGPLYSVVEDPASMTGLHTCLAELRKDRFFGRYFAEGGSYLQPYASKR